MTKIYYALFFILLSLSASAQKLKITGKVTDEKGEALIGASVVEKGTSNGTSTDGNGIYTLTVGYYNATLIATYVGYNKIEKEINGQETQNFTLADATLLSQVTVVGSRNLNRSSTDTPAPIDVINIQEVTTKQGQLDVNQLLQFAAPSFNSNRQTGSDGADHVDPASLRGLGPDQTLVLINGKRRHQSALVNLFGSRGRGNTGTDLNAIPAAAIERIEILRDGAAAQYGSDAIAGVINIVLKETVNQLTANVNAGMYKAKYRYDDKKFDGQNYNVNLNYGVKIAKTGFLNVTADYNFRDHTNRANTSPIDEISRRQYGDPQMKNAAIYYNAKIPLGKNIQVYSFGGHNTRNGDAYAWTRFADDVKNIPAIYPNGFDPIIASKITDNAATVGIRGVWKQWDIDLSNTYGFNRFHFSVKNSLNTSLGLQSPTSFDAGGFQLGQNVTNLNFTRNYKTVLSGLNVAFGGEYRMERYKIFAGEEASYKTYDQNFAGGSQGFPGFSPVDVTNHGRSNVAAYLDVEADITKKLLVDAAARFENYSDFGSTLNGKLGARYKLTDDIAIRGSVSTGFRAPSLAQKYFNSTFTNFVNGQAVQVLLANNNSAVTKALGIPQLKQETSENASLGITVTPKASALSITVDGYYVKVKNRVVLTGQFSDEDEAIGPLLKSLNVGQAQFFTNALSYTTTKGIDVIIAHSMPLGRGRFSTTLASNFNWMKLGPINTSPKLAGKEDTYFNQRERSFVLASAPPSKINLTFDYTISKLSFMVRFVRFGKIKLTNWNYGSTDSETGNEYTPAQYTDIYKPKIQTDVTVNYKFSKQFSFSVGGSNILNVYPNMSKPYLTESGGAWDPVQMGSNGAFLFTRLGFRF